MDTSKTGSSDNLQHSFSYGQICKDLTSAVEAKTFVDIDRLTNALCEAARSWPGQEINGQVLLPKAFLRIEGGFRKHFARSKLPEGEWGLLEDRWVVEGIKAACIIGVNAHERLEKQTVNVGLTVSWTRLARASDQGSLLPLSTEQWQALVKRVLVVRLSHRVHSDVRITEPVYRLSRLPRSKHSRLCPHSLLDDVWILYPTSRSLWRSRVRWVW